ncbi:hypothetical protein MJO28_011702 [Puccinia striiformis f. sp. tritici]|uniref:Reverse transcriptase domain-containing protein n=2 Tax=Puccinia striiformis TaxID=27350 RepID=A0A2S4WIE6_9BASI|nr:hypothetical protein MJO28_011702 [Puccinia striiformis f. sp. tritici]POW21560.1 hypothetical protein PSHT_02244 [Puccinia striiformis]
MDACNEKWLSVLPGGIKCEMNVQKWQEIFVKHKLLPEFQDVLDGFVKGFDQGIPQHKIKGLNYLRPDNHKSSEVAREKIESCIKKEVLAGRMIGPFSLAIMKKEFGFFRSNPLGAVVNNDGSVRPINDLSFPRGNVLIPSVNSFVKAEDFSRTWDDFNTVSRFFAEDERDFELALFDWEKAYRQIPTRRDQWAYLLVKDFNRNFLVDTQITFGGVAGCGSFGRPADAWKLIMKQEFNLVNVFRWVDNNLFVRLKSDQISMEDVIKLSTELGVMTNEEKGSPFSEEQKFIGFVWNGVAKTVRLPEGKMPSKFFLQVNEVMVGQTCEEAYTSRRAERSQDLERDVRIEVYEHTRIISWGPAIDIGWEGDTSTSFGIGVLIGKTWAQFKLVNQHNNPKDILLLETVAVRLGLLMALGMRDQKGKRLIVWTVNTMTENGINNKKSRDIATNANGLKAWHNYHGQPYPAGIEKRVALMVKSAAKEDAKRPKKTVKPAVKLHHLLVLADGLATGSNKDLAILDLAIITFWGMARLKELVFTDHMVTGDAPTGADGILARDKQSASIV